MKLGVIADTHDNVDAIERAVSAFREEGIEVVIHCGDFIAPPVLPLFEGFELHGVLGNNDGEIDGLERGFEALDGGSRLHGRYADLTFGGRRVRVLHGDQGLDAVDEAARADGYDFALYGHFHEADHREVDGTTVVNPGAHFPTVPPAHRSVAVIDTDSDPDTAPDTEAVRFVSLADEP